MFNYSFPQVFYCQAPTQFYGFPMAQSMMVSICPTIQYNQYESMIQKQNHKKITESVEMNSTQKPSEEKPLKPQVKTTSSPRNHKKIKRSTKTQSRGSKKSLFKNSYLSFAIHKLLTFIGNKTASQEITISLIKKFNNTEEDPQEILKLFYEQHDNVMKYIINNASIRKIRQLWTGEFIQKIQQINSSSQSKMLIQIYRSLSKIFFDRFYSSFLLRSKKVRKSTMNVHLKMRRYLVQNLKNPENFICYDGFD